MARTNPQIKAALLKKLGVTEQRLSQLVAARKRELPMDTPMAVYTIAHEKGVDISRHLEAGETREVRGLVSDLRKGGQPPQAPTNGGAKAPTRSRSAAAKQVKVTIAGVDVGQVPALKKSHADDAKRMAERVYPTLYIFENSVRDLIEAVLRDKHGKDWWKTAVPSKVRETAKKHKADEKKDGWHSARGRRAIDYVFLNDLWAIIRDNWGDFKALFPDQAWVQSLITNDMNVSRRVLAHMNPLGADDVSNIEAAFRKWTKQLRAVADKLP